VEYVEVTLDDLAVANRLAHEVLGRSLDELAPQTRRLLNLLDTQVRDACARLAMARTAYRFTRREVRAWTGWSDFQVRTHLERLVTLEYVLVHRGGRGQGFVYELLYDGQGQDGEPFVMGLVDVEALRAALRSRALENVEGSPGHFEPLGSDSEGRSRPHRAVIEPGASGADREPFARPDEDMRVSAVDSRQNAHLDGEESAASYVRTRRTVMDASPVAAEGIR
jgi:hypothetical protein